MKISYVDVISINKVLSNCVSNKEFSTEAMIKMLDLKEELKSVIDKYSKIFTEIIDQYKIEQINGSYNWTGHKDEKTITKKIDDLFKTETEIKNTNFLNAEQFVKMVPDGLNLDELNFISKFLRISK